MWATEDSRIIEDLKGYLSWLIQRFQVYAPIKIQNRLEFSLMNQDQLRDLYLGKPVMPPKKLIFPQSQILFHFEQGKIVESPIESQPWIIFGIRLCDSHGIKVFDRVFQSQPRDELYMRKMRFRKLIGILDEFCLRSPRICFCTSFDLSDDFLNAMLIHLGDGKYLARIRDPELIHPALRKSSSEERDRAREIWNRYLETGRKIVLDGIQDRLREVFHDSKLWEEISLSCIGCGICTYLCPCCYCFDIQDEVIKHRGERLRIWDSCMYPEFSLQASGFNPRSQRWQRIRNRIMHKFSYMVQDFGIHGCSGCGRCIRNCPAGLDLGEILERILHG